MSGPTSEEARRRYEASRVYARTTIRNRYQDEWFRLRKKHLAMSHALHPDWSWRRRSFAVEAAALAELKRNHEREWREARKAYRDQLNREEENRG